MANSGVNIIVPQEQKINLEFDACALNELASVKRRRKGSWLDLLPQTLQLPTVNFIIIPAIVADWELRGGASIINDEGQLEFIRVDKDFADPKNKKGKHGKAFSELFATASQYRHNGYEYQVTLGSNPRLIIVETDLQRKLLARLAAISRIPDEEEKIRQIFLFRAKRDTGERMMEHIAATAPLSNPIFLISNDIAHFKTRDNDQVTVSGHPIGTATVLDYIYAELNARPKYIQARLGSASIDDYRQAAVDAGLFKHSAINSYPQGYKEAGAGSYLAGTKKVRGESLWSAFERGVAVLDGNLPPYNFPLPTPPAKFEPELSPLASLAAIFATKLRDNTEWIKSILYDYQIPMIEAIIDDLAAGNTGGTMKEPTGSGKTVVMGTVIKTLDTRTLVLVPKRTIANNTAKEFIEKAGINSNDIGVYHTKVSKQDREKALDKKILITTSMSAIRLCGRELIKRGDFQYIALDEAHKMRGAVTAGIIKSVLVPDSIIHTWTATDKFYDGSLVGETLFGRKSHIHATTIKQAINQGWLPDTKNIIIKTHVDYDETPATQGLTEKQQRALASRTGRDEQALTMSYSYVDADTGIVFSEQQSIWFCAGVVHAQRIANKLNELHGEGYARAVSGKSKDQEDIIADYKAGKFKAIVNADLLIEGLNNPNCSVCYILRDVMSPINMEQMGGRVERLNPFNPHKIAFVVNLVDQGRPYSLVFADVAEGWLLKSNKGLLDRSPMLAEKNTKVLPPEYPPLESLDIVETDREFVEFFSERDDARKALIVPAKTDDWFTKTDAIRHLGTWSGNTTLVKLLDKIEKEYSAYGRFELEGLELTVGYRATKTVTPFCFHITAVAIIARHLKLDIEDKTPAWKNKTETAEALGIAPYRGGFERLWTALEEEFDRTGTAKIDGTDIICGRKKTPEHTMWKSFCVHVSELEKVKGAIGLKTAEWLAQHDMEKVLGASRKNAEFVALWQDLRTQYQTGGAAKIGDKEIKCGIKGNDNNPAFCIHANEAPFIKAHLKLDIPRKTDDWLNLKQSGQALRTSPTDSPLTRLWEKMDKEVRETGNATIDGIKIRAQIMQASSNRIMCVHKDDLHLLKKPLNIVHEEKTGEWLNKTDLMRSLGMTRTSALPELTELYDLLGRQFQATGRGVVDGNEIRLEYKRAGIHTLMCVHTDNIVHLRRYLGRVDEKKSEGWVGKYEFMDELKVASNNESYFAKLFDSIKAAYDRGEQFNVGEHTVKCGYKVSATTTAFYVHKDCLPHVRKEHKLDLFDKGGTWRASFEYARLLGTHHIDKAFKRLWSTLEAASVEGAAPEINGQKIKCGHKRVGNILRFYVNTEHAAILRPELERIRTEARQGNLNNYRPTPEGSYSPRYAPAP